MTHIPEIESVRRRGLGWWSVVLWGGLACLLLLPLLAMRFTTEVDWSPFDFMVMGGLLGAVGGAFELAARASGGMAYRAGAGIAVVTSFLLIWVNLAVGFIGDEDNPANLMFAGLLLTGLIGAVTVRFRPRGMVWTVASLAILQIIIGVIGHANDHAVWPQTVVFALFWAASAALFHIAASPRRPLPA